MAGEHGQAHREVIVVHDIEASVGFYQEQADLFREGFAFAKTDANPPLMVLNATQIFVATAACALMRWRAGQDPVALVEKTLDESGSHLEDMVRAGVPDEFLSGFPAERLAFLAYLMGRDLGFLWRFPAPASEYAALDRKLLSALCGMGSVADLVELNDRFSKKKRHALAAESYRCYGAILMASSAGAAFDAELALAERCYDERSRNSFYSGGEEIEGGGPGNSKFLDYRLACVLKAVGYPGPSAHLWRW